MRVHFTRYWTLAGGAGCVGPAPGGWTSVTVPRAGHGARRRALLAGARARIADGSCRRRPPRAEAPLGCRPADERPAQASRVRLVGGRSSALLPLAACGEWRRRRRPSVDLWRRPAAGAGARGDRSRATGPYRWLVRTAGAPPSIAAENRARRDDRLAAARSRRPPRRRSPRARSRATWPSRRSLPGETETVYVNAPRRAHGHAAGLPNGLVRRHRRAARAAERAPAGDRASRPARTATSPG